MTLEEEYGPILPPLYWAEEGRVIRVRDTRIPLDRVVGCYLDGWTPEEIVSGFDTLDLADVYETVSYYLRNRAKVEAYLEKRRIESEEIRRENERRWPSAEFKARLIARRELDLQEHHARVPHG